ncbi:polyphosphate--glucose phosphotransferase [Luedemannella helvata]|uniref:ROK family protein n=1 Tax=Luedemannella helvata TaxID=349315 RepID=A0ABN2KB02_9ACTN
MIVGIDIGGSGIKAAPVDLDKGAFAADRHRVETPQPATVDDVVAAAVTTAAVFGDAERIGITFPGVVQHGVVRTAANMHSSWIDAPAERLFAEALGRPVVVLNDADAAGVAEMTYGAGRDHRGVVIMLTFGTGIGSAVFVDGRLLPNTEFGHLHLRGGDAEDYASDRARQVHDLDWDKWAHRVQTYLRHLEGLLNPDLFLVGGGVSKKADRFLPHIEIRTPIAPATLRNDAGIIGAALAASRIPLAVP